MTDMVNHPPHYTATAYEPIDIIAAIGNPFCRGNAIKYLARAGRKGDEVEDLKKARWYVERLLKTHEAFVPMKAVDAGRVATAWSGGFGPKFEAVRAVLAGDTSTHGTVKDIDKAIIEAGASREADTCRARSLPVRLRQRGGTLQERDGPRPCARRVGAMLRLEGERGRLHVCVRHALPRP